MPLFTVIAKLIFEAGICSSWYEIALLGCSFVDCGMKLHLPTACNHVKELFAGAWQFFLLQLLPLRLQDLGGMGLFLSSCHLKKLQSWLRALKELDLCVIRKQAEISRSFGVTNFCKCCLTVLLLQRIQ